VLEQLVKLLFRNPILVKNVENDYPELIIFCNSSKGVQEYWIQDGHVLIILDHFPVLVLCDCQILNVNKLNRYRDLPLSATVNARLLEIGTDLLNFAKEPDSFLLLDTILGESEIGIIFLQILLILGDLLY